MPRYLLLLGLLFAGQHLFASNATGVASARVVASFASVGAVNGDELQDKAVAIASVRSSNGPAVGLRLGRSADSGTVTVASHHGDVIATISRSPVAVRHERQSALPKGLVTVTLHRN